jgi:hypothetical protein
MTYRVSGRARRDLQQIWRYIADDATAEAGIGSGCDGGAEAPPFKHCIRGIRNQVPESDKTPDLVFDARCEPRVSSPRGPDKQYRCVARTGRHRGQNIVNGEVSVRLEGYSGLG